MVHAVIPQCYVGQVKVIVYMWARAALLKIIQLGPVTSCQHTGQAGQAGRPCSICQVVGAHEKETISQLVLLILHNRHVVFKIII